MATARTKQRTAKQEAMHRIHQAMNHAIVDGEHDVATELWKIWMNEKAREG